MADPALELDLSTQQALATARQKAMNQYGQKKAQLGFQRSALDATHNQSQAEMGLQWDRYRTRLPGRFAGRGLLNSGIYHQGLQDYAVDRGNAYTKALMGYQQQVGGLDLSGRGLEQDYADSMATIAAQEQLARSQVAAALRGLL